MFKRRFHAQVKFKAVRDLEFRGNIGLHDISIMEGSCFGGKFIVEISCQFMRNNQGLEIKNKFDWGRGLALKYFLSNKINLTCHHH